MKTSRRGFTLVELLVVIGIIALLISILLPTLGKARNAAKAIACQSNMRQVGLAIASYLVDSKGVFPPTSALDNPSDWPWEKPGWHQLLRAGGYIPNFQVMTCPMAVDEFNHHLPDDPLNYYGKLMHYGINYYFITGFTNTYGFITEPVRISQIKQSSETILLVDALRWAPYPNRTGTWRIRPYFSIGSESEQADTRHSDACNVLWVDGHVEAVAGKTENGSIYGPNALTSYIDPVNYWDRK